MSVCARVYEMTGRIQSHAISRKIAISFCEYTNSAYSLKSYVKHDDDDGVFLKADKTSEDESI